MKAFALTGAAAAMAVWSATDASAATYFYEFLPDVAGPTVASVDNSSDSGANAATNPDLFTITAGYVAPFSSGSALVSQTTSGLGVQAPWEPVGGPGAGTIDGNPLLTAESLTVTFAYAVTLDNFTLGSFENGDDYSVLVETTSGSQLSFSSLTFNQIDVAYVTAFTIFAIGVPIVDGFLTGNDEFTLKGLQVSSVPLPAAAGLLLGALGLLGAARRRRG